MTAAQLLTILDCRWCHAVVSANRCHVYIATDLLSILEPKFEMPLDHDFFLASLCKNWIRLIRQSFDWHVA